MTQAELDRITAWLQSPEGQQLLAEGLKEAESLAARFAQESRYRTLEERVAALEEKMARLPARMWDHPRR